MNKYLRNLSFMPYLSRSMFFSLISLAFSILMIYLATWSPSIQYLTEPANNINYLIIHFVKHNQRTFLGLGALSFLLTIAFIIVGNMQFVFRVLLSILISLVFLYIVALFIPIAFRDVAGFSLIQREKVDRRTYNLVNIEYIEHISNYYVVVYDCDNLQWNCQVDYSLSVPASVSWFENPADVYRLEMTNNILEVTDGDTIFWSTELGD